MNRMNEARKQKRLLSIAREWANELSKFKGQELLVADVVAWGFIQVMERGRHPDVVLQEVLAKIKERLPQ